MVKTPPCQGEVSGSSPDIPAILDRMKRTHVKNVRWKDEKAIITLEDKNKGDAGEMIWHEWINGGCEDLKLEGWQRG